jgi:hypothetical protein
MVDIIRFLIKEFGSYECYSDGNDMIFKISLGEYNLDISVKDGTTLQEFKDNCNAEYIKLVNNKIDFLKARIQYLELQLNKPFFNK